MGEAAAKMYPVKLGPQGRAVIPAPLRKAMQVQPGDTLVAWLEGDQMVVKSREALLKELQGMLAHVKGSMVDELIAERRAEAKQEEEEFLASENRRGRS